MGILVDFGYGYSEAEAMGNGLYRGVRGMWVSLEYRIFAINETEKIRG